MLDYLRLLVELFWQPSEAIRKLRDRAPVAFAFFAAWIATALYVFVTPLLLFHAQNGDERMIVQTGDDVIIPPETGVVPLGFYQTALWAVMIVLFLAAVYVPVMIFLANLWERRLSFSFIVRDEYAPTASCVLSAWAVSLLAALLPVTIIGWQSARLNSEAIPLYTVLLFVLPLPIFALLTTTAIRVIFRLGWPQALVSTIGSSVSMIALPVLMQAFTIVCASPFLALLVLFLLRDQLDDFFSAQRSRQSLRQNLQAATLNPADASAHYQLGLIYQQQGDFGSATASFKRAIEIDMSETDAHYQLGRLAREQGRPSEAIEHFNIVVQQNSAHSQHEIWREIALTYRVAEQHEDALQMLDRFLNERPSDAEARYWRGMTLAALNRPVEAEAEMNTCIESVRTAPAYKYRTEKRWLHLAQSYLRERQA